MNRKIDKPVLEKPIVGGSKDVWGDILNVNIDNTEKFHTQLLSDLETKDAELARLERDKANKSDLPDLVHPIVDNYVESSVKPQVETYISQKADPIITAQTEVKKQELNRHVETINKPELDEYTESKKEVLDTHTVEKQGQLDSYEKAKEGQLDSHTNTKKEELNQHTVQKQGQLDEYTVAKKSELDSHTIEKKNELNTHEKAKEKELDSYVTTVNKPELDKYTNIKKEELNSHTTTKESEITQVTETKKQEITTHGASELDKFNQGAKQEADKQIGRVVAEGDVQVQRVKDESNGVIPRIEKLEDGKVSKSGDTMSGNLKIKKPSDVSSIDIYSQNESYGTINKDDNGIKLLSSSGASSLVAYDNGDLKLSNNINRSNIKLEGKNISISTEGIIDLKSTINSSSSRFAYTLNNEDNGVGRYAAFGSLKSSPQNTCYGSYWSNNLENTEYYIFEPRRKQGIFPSCVLVNGDFGEGFSIYAQTDISKQMNIKTKENCEQVFIANLTGVKAYSKYLTTHNKEVISAINELNSKKADLTGSTFTGLVAIKKDTNGEAMVALNSAYGNGDIYSGGSAKGVGFRNRTSGKGIFFGDDGSAKFFANNLNTNSKEVVGAINELNSDKVSKSGDTMTGDLTLKSVNFSSGSALKHTIDTSERLGGWAYHSAIWNVNDTIVSAHGIYGDQLTPQYIYWGKGKGYDNDSLLRLYFDGTVKLNAKNLNTNSKEVIEAINSIYSDINTSLTLDSNIGNHIVLKRSGELKGSLTSNVDGIALYNEKSGKMIELKDDGIIKIPNNSAQYVGGISNLDNIKDSGWYYTPANTVAAPTTDYLMVNNFFENPTSAASQHQLAYATLKSGYIYHRRVGKDWVRMANENDINDLKKEIAELRAEIQKLKVN